MGSGRGFHRVSDGSAGELVTVIRAGGEVFPPAETATTSN